MRRLPAFVLALLVAAADLISKSLVFDALAPGDIRYVAGEWFRLTRVLNPGVTGGLGGGLPPQVFVVLTSLAVVGIVVYMVRSRTATRMMLLGLALILGGAAGNLYDRIAFAKVRDFIDILPGLSWGPSWLEHWPTFNLADVAIVCGVILLIFLTLFFGKEKEKEKGESVAGAA